MVTDNFERAISPIHGFKGAIWLASLCLVQQADSAVCDVSFQFLRQASDVKGYFDAIISSFIEKRVKKQRFRAGNVTFVRSRPCCSGLASWLAGDAWPGLVPAVPLP
ncbi:hypothetical protein K504DRAFT_79367 [Pleomassaria siparia CBS 279.74]|uniref:Uncharacterized protein n=1 Tax=Pleomassaria siparia CBS 279.74 TaxID=1314801 RepID=A0A6G1K0H4_9PLEO|nr:hypothetical protein K504DRAFT_79367 [Pleomassaria siparia CBS 279.74]